ncbi:hypothetical protein IFM12276_14020 [Nocardia sputorum]|uniref:Uncharacterized protein n=1 Tax=Nocardia sputorum TaxID=2984338 RepID=A0ABM8CTX1_9NOCA|nr:hypothetical protein IFM12276_14020 [Nocardia sputorum]
MSREMPNRDAIARIDRPSLAWRYLICAHSCTEITLPIVDGWPIFKERRWPDFRRALTFGTSGNEFEFTIDRSTLAEMLQLGSQALQALMPASR